MTTLKTTSVSENPPKKYRGIHQRVLDNMPKDLVQEMARRRLAELEQIDREEAALINNQK